MSRMMIVLKQITTKIVNGDDNEQVECFFYIPVKNHFVIRGEDLENNFMSKNSSFPGEKLFSGEKPFSGRSHFLGRSHFQGGES